ncbi:MAG: phosphate acyltransferase PlsX [Pseudomonadota bacterium]
MSVTIAVDMMGGDGSAEPAILLAGVAEAAYAHSRAKFLLFGDAEKLRRAIDEGPPDLDPAVIEVRHAPEVVKQDDKPGEVVRKADGTSMAGALATVASGEASAVVSCGNTGALMALSLLKLRRMRGVIRPAIAVQWPSVAPGKEVVVLDVGADVRMEPRNLRQFAAMGASFAQVGLGVSWPRVGLLNIGAEAHKGKPQLHEASSLIAEAATDQDFEYLGFVEANDIPMDVVDVVVTDGFTGNVALKAAEGTARLIKAWMKEAFKGSPLAQAGGLLAARALKQMSENLDPSRVNGGVFLGLNGAVVKSHGSVDAAGFAAAVSLAARVAEERLIDRVAETLKMAAAAQG